MSENRTCMFHLFLDQAAIGRAKGMFSGTRVLDNVEYNWQWQTRTLCISYLRAGNPNNSCETY